ncbi:MAG: Gfo/Idh/MocA family oxidoreductase [Acidobacteria bacterium]|nr:Gfo/Idh/MocA family oxidoreductase [Acidobacteriota bacterium]MCA1618398.1 Gfo/Idh/MocA family oxidoreductase [Acidobacteriota bacterium]
MYNVGMSKGGTGAGDELRVGLIGFGLAGAVFHAPLISATPGLRLAAVVTSNPERSEQARREYTGALVLETPEQLWGLARELDLVVVATPNRTHAPLASAALDAGLAVVVDKPLAATAAEGRALVGEARRRGLLLTVFQNRRWDGDFLTLRHLLERGALGRVLRFESRYERWRPRAKPGWRQSGEPEDAGGLLYDLGSHLVDQALLLFGPARRVYAELGRPYPGVETDNDTFVALEHAAGVRSHLWMSTAAAQPGPRFRALGSEGAYTKFGLDVQEEALKAGGRPGSPGWGEEPESLWGLFGAGEDLRPLRTEPGCHQCFYRGVAAALREGVPPPVDPAESVAVLEVIEAARRSHDKGQTVVL